jgi:7,8-dihydro-6-hydroxymethylpterin-pyrophosphokinase
MVEELEQVEKQARKERRKNRMLWVLIGLDIILFGYAVFEIIKLVIALAK